MKQFFKLLFFPGADLHTRSRHQVLPQYFRAGDIETLDAGCGNGALSYAAYRRGNRVTGVSLDTQQIERNRNYFKSIGISEDRLRFQVMNLHDLPKLGLKFDQIICSETLEHITDDNRVIQTFSELLKAGGVLHLCCPNALHPQHNLGRTNNPEDGGHVRDGYTYESYEKLLKPHGFKLSGEIGIGDETLVRADDIVRRLRNRFGDLAAFPAFAVLWPYARLRGSRQPKVPYSIYVRATKN